MKRKSLAIHSNVSAKGFHIICTTRYPPPNMARSRSATSFQGKDPKGYGMGSRCIVRGDKSCGCTFPRIISHSQYSFSNRIFTSVCKCKYETVGPLQIIQACQPTPSTPPICNPATNLDTPSSSDYIHTLHQRMCTVQPLKSAYHSSCKPT